MNVCVTLVPSEVTSVFHLAQQLEPGRYEADAFHPEGGFVGFDEQGDLLLERHLEWIALDGCYPRASDGRRWCKLDRVALHGPCGARNGDSVPEQPSARRRGSSSWWRRIPAPIDERAHAKTVRFLV
jgi:hypothetical protein